VTDTQDATVDTARDGADRGGTRNNSSSLRRALSILLELGADSTPQAGLTLIELAAALELNRSTLLRLLAPLVETRLVERDPGTSRYRLGSRNAQLGQVFLERLDRRRVAHEVLVDLVRQCGETVHLVNAELPEVVYIDKIDSPQAVRMHSRIGNRMPCYSTSVGKAILAHADEATVEMVVRNGMPARTPTTITTAEGLRSDLALIRERGYALDDSENEPDIRCVAAPLFDHAGEVSSAISISGPAHRVTPEREAELGRLVAVAADEISRRLGATR
jgi:DNA-binding IclR family transcriptional regulator